MSLDKKGLLKHLVSNLDIKVFPVFSMNEQKRICSCRKGASCPSPGKHPAVYDKSKGKSWKNQSTQDLAMIDAWLKVGYNFGVACGVQQATKNCLVVIDIDVETHPLLIQLNKMDTFGYRTGRGGYHFWFYCKEKVKNSVCQIAANIDVRGEGGYVVVPPSNHHSGGTYEPFEGWETKEIKQSPDWLLEMLKGNEIEFRSEAEWSVKGKATLNQSDSLNTGVVRGWRKGDATVEEIRRKVLDDGVKAPLGARHDLVFRLSSSDRGKGEIMTFAQVNERVRSYNTTGWLVEPLEEDEIKAIVNSVLKFRVFNTDYRKVNCSYVRWSLTHDKTWDMPKNWAEQLDKLDDEFFEELRRSATEEKLITPSFKGTPLSEIQNKRDEWLAHRGVVKHAKYSPRLFAKKLESVGFQSHRYARGVLWEAKEGWTFAEQTQLEFLKDKASDELISEAAQTEITDLFVPKTVKVLEDKFTGVRHVSKVAGGTKKKKSTTNKKITTSTDKHKRYLVPIEQTEVMKASFKFVSEVVDPWIVDQTLKPRLEVMPKKKLKLKKDEDTLVLNRF